MFAGKLINPQIVEPLVNYSAVDYGNRLIQGLIYIGFAVSALAFAILFIVGGISYISASGDKQKLEAAREKVVNAITGLVILLLLWMIIKFVNSIFNINIGGLGVGIGDTLPTKSPDRPSICADAAIDSDIMQEGGSIAVTLYANEEVKEFILGFYNLDNIRETDGTPEEISFVAGTKYTMTSGTIPVTNAYTFIINYSDINHPDLNWDVESNYPRNIQVNGYFVNVSDHTSEGDIDCVESFRVETVTGICSEYILCDCDCGSGYVVDESTCAADGDVCTGSCSCVYVAPTPTPTPIINSASGKSCDDYCNPPIPTPDWEPTWCGSIGVNYGCTEGTMYENIACSPENYIWTLQCSQVADAIDPVTLCPDSSGYAIEWTGCNCTNGVISQGIWADNGGDSFGYSRYAPINGPSDTYPGYPIYSFPDAKCFYHPGEEWCYIPCPAGPIDYYGDSYCMPGVDSALETVDAQSENLLPDAGDCGLMVVSVWGKNDGNEEGWYIYVPVSCEGYDSNDSYPAGYPDYTRMGCAAGLYSDNDQWCATQYNLPGPYNGSDAVLETVETQSSVLLPNVKKNYYKSGVLQGESNGVVLTTTWGWNTEASRYEGYSVYAPISSIDGQPRLGTDLSFSSSGSSLCLDSSASSVTYQWCGPYTEFGPTYDLLSTPIAHSEVLLFHVSGNGMVSRSVWGLDKSGVLKGYSTSLSIDADGLPIETSNDCFYNYNTWCGPFLTPPNPTGTMTAQSEGEMPLMDMSE